jgi:ligand-binding sensor domain-containing protein/serine phosphatase RsbU (regulator of sigma subunit)
MQYKPTVLLFALGILLVSLTGKSQEYRITNFGISEGITYPFVYTISQDDRGFVWVGTGMGLCRFDGFKFSTDMVPDTLAGQVVGISFKDSSGTLWFGYQSGQIARYDGGSFELVSAGVEINSSITGFAELKDGIILIATLNSGMFAYNSATGKGIPVNGPETGMYTALMIKGNAMLLGSQEGLSLYSIDNAGEKAVLKVKVTELENIKIQDIQSSLERNTYWIATEDQGIFRLTLNGEQYSITKTGLKFNLGSENVQAVYEAPNHQLWVSTLRNGVYRLGQPDGKGDYGMATAFNKGNGLRSNAVKKVFEDLEGNIWIATYGDGISLFSGQPMAFTRMETSGLDNDILAIAVTGDNQYFLGGQGGLFRYTPGKDKSPVKVQGVPADKVTALHLDGPRLFVGTETKGLFLMDMQRNTVRNIPYESYSMGKWISGITSDDKYVYLGTKDGIYRLGNDFKEEAHFTTNDGLPHNNIEHVLIDNKGRLLFATRSKGIYELTGEGTVNLLYPVDQADVEFKSLAEDANGNIWAATNGDGVICFKKDTVVQITVASGLKSNFCYSLIRASENGIWVGHRLGMSRINTLNMHASVYDQNMGITGDCNVNAVTRDKAGIVYFGTTEGLISYDPAKDSGKKLPPFTNIVNLLISDRAVDFSKDIDIVLPYKPYKLRIEFIGLNYSDPQSVRYQYKLEGHDLDWSDVTSQTYVTYPRIEDGEYTFYLRSFNNEGLTQEVPVTLKIRVKPPIWKTWWFILLSILAAAFAVYAIIKFREKKQKQLQEYLERELKARTKEVVEQKEVIEIKNRDITDSINYAKRIQTSMLPPVKRLQQHFTGSFVFYHPRDIVSGDFYWFDQINETKFTIVCADSTGHGVPGAFMSMIGSTLIKDICTREANNAPSKVLQVLDTELRNTLNQNLEDGTKPGDGMDIIVCEIDMKTHYVRFASAMRPMIIYRNGEEVFVKGSRNSIGGHYDKEDNQFEDEGIQLSKGDIIYMFSDGYSDQFGGPMGKKFKMVRLKNLLQDIHTKPMDEQCIHVKNTFHLWKENYEQVDDVLFMGIKI